MGYRLWGRLLMMLVFSLSAHAGECPAGERQDPAAAQKGPADYRGVTGGANGRVPLDDFAGLRNRDLRIRRIEVAAGGVIGWHRQADRPGLTTIIAGEITEYRADCRVGIVHRAGDTVKETVDVAHWWRNESQAPATLLMADIAR